MKILRNQSIGKSAILVVISLVTTQSHLALANGPFPSYAPMATSRKVTFPIVSPLVRLTDSLESLKGITAPVFNTVTETVAPVFEKVTPVGSVGYQTYSLIPGTQQVLKAVKLLKEEKDKAVPSYRVMTNHTSLGASGLMDGTMKASNIIATHTNLFRPLPPVMAAIPTAFQAVAAATRLPQADLTPQERREEKIKLAVAGISTVCLTAHAFVSDPTIQLATTWIPVAAQVFQGADSYLHPVPFRPHAETFQSSASAFDKKHDSTYIRCEYNGKKVWAKEAHMKGSSVRFSDFHATGGWITARDARDAEQSVFGLHSSSKTVANTHNTIVRACKIAILIDQGQLNPSRSSKEDVYSLLGSIDASEITFQAQGSKYSSAFPIALHTKQKTEDRKTKMEKGTYTFEWIGR